jgi:hypothetical protein
MPLLYVNDLAAGAHLAMDTAVDQRIKDAIDRLLARQGSNGSFGLWSAGGDDAWLDAYVTDFLTRARERGFAVPDVAFKLALDRLRNFVGNAEDPPRTAGAISPTRSVWRAAARLQWGSAASQTQARRDRNPDRQGTAAAARHARPGARGRIFARRRVVPAACADRPQRFGSVLRDAAAGDACVEGGAPRPAERWRVGSARPALHLDAGERGWC